jgi:hypothetical protein
MPYDSKGNFSLPNGSTATTGTTVLASQHNIPLADIVSNGLSTVVLRDGRASMSGDLPMGGNKVTDLADGTASTDAATVGQAAFAIGDFKSSLNDLGSKWLRRDGSLYTSASYPDLSALLPALADGLTWSNVSHSVPSSIKSIIQITGGYLIAVSAGSDSSFYTSSDGLSWSLVGTITSFAIEEVALGGGVYVAVDGNGYTAVSSDAISWTKSGSATFTTGASGVAYGGSVFVGVGVGGEILTSPDGATWTSRTSGTTNLLNAVRRVGSVFVAVGVTGTVVTSPDGTTWTVRTSGTTNTLNDVAFDATTYVIVGDTGKIISSTDLATWTSRTSGTTSNLLGITLSTSGFVTVGASGVCAISTSGTSWALAATGVGANLASVTYNASAQTNYFAAGVSTIIKGVRTSPTQFQVPDDDPDYGWIKALA